MITVAIVMEPTVGSALAKGCQGLTGTLIGSALALAIQGIVLGVTGTLDYDRHTVGVVRTSGSGPAAGKDVQSGAQSALWG